MRQDRCGNFYCIVERQQADHPSGRIGTPGQPASESGAGRHFDLFNKLAHDFIEEVDLGRGEFARAEHEKVSHPPQHFCAL